MFATRSTTTPQPGQILARGVCRFLTEAGFAPITEYAPVTGLRTDVTALSPKGEIWVVECKSCLADFQSDAKWRGYLEWCDRFFFAIPEDFPMDVLPDDEGLIIADGFDAEIARDAPSRPLAAARRKAQTLRIGRIGLLRLRAGLDAGTAALVSAREA